ncbi:MAG TPA: ubiquinol-cytochrome C chaperone family protein [Caulobacteraceae bacterium]|jgi:cytochrome b pre-mRNA-processing protein 3|nr:ubiquinol-cytochrome C chaperone family protein [Caulobacteraceae bacterium]
MLDKLFRQRPAKAFGARLYAAAVAQARSPAFYSDLGVPDEIDARFELYVVHVVLLQQRLAGHGAAAAETAQALFDAFIQALDDSLRELGVGDLSVSKKMRRLGEALFGRATAYRDLLAGPDREGITGLIARTVYGDEAALERAAPLADYVIRAHAALALEPLPALLQGQVVWPEAEVLSAPVVGAVR